jgi:hypothetical protein
VRPGRFETWPGCCGRSLDEDIGYFLCCGGSKCLFCPRRSLKSDGFKELAGFVQRMRNEMFIAVFFIFIAACQVGSRQWSDMFGQGSTGWGGVQYGRIHEAHNLQWGKRGTARLASPTPSEHTSVHQHTSGILLWSQLKWCIRHATEPEATPINYIELTRVPPCLSIHIPIPRRLVCCLGDPLDRRRRP